MNLLSKQKQTHRLQNELLVVGLKDAGKNAGKVRDFGMHMYTLLWITTKDQLCSTWNSA